MKKLLLCLAFLSIILILNITLIVKSYTNKDEVPSIGGFTPMVVLTESMKPNINSGDLVITTKEEPKNIKVGDIIEIQFGTKTVKAEVLDIQETTKKEEAKELFRYL